MDFEDFYSYKNLKGLPNSKDENPAFFKKAALIMKAKSTNEFKYIIKCIIINTTNNNVSENYYCICFSTSTGIIKK